MKVLFKIFKPAPYIQEIEDPHIVERDYKYWRIRTFYSIYIGYIFYQFTKRSFCMSVEAMHLDLGYTREQLGWVASTLTFSYGISKFVNGVISDRSNPRYFMSIGLIISGILNCLLGMYTSIWSFAFIWALNGWFQGWGAAPCARLLTHWYSKKKRGKLWALWSTSINVGFSLIPIIIGKINESLGWKFGFYIVGGLSVGMGLILINRLRDTPRSLGLPTIEKFDQEHSDQEQSSHNQENEQKLAFSTRELLFKYVLNNKWIWLLGLSYTFIYASRQGLENWAKSFLIKQKGYGETRAGLSIFIYGVGGFLGPLVGAWFSDKIFKGRRGPVVVLSSLFLIISVSGFWLIPHISDLSILSSNPSRFLFPQGIVIQSAILDGVILAAMGFFVMCPQTLMGLFAAELSHKKAAGTAVGFIGVFAYLGASLGGGPLGRLIDHDTSWNNYIFFFIGSALLAFIFLLPLWGVKTSNGQSDT